MLKRSLGDSTEKVGGGKEMEKKEERKNEKTEPESDVDHGMAPATRFRFAKSSFYGTSREKIGSGTFSVVFWISSRSDDSLTNSGESLNQPEFGSETKNYALKKFVDDRCGNEVSVFAIREIAILQAIVHPAIVRVLDVCDLTVFEHREMSMLLDLASMTLDKEVAAIRTGKLKVDRRLRNDRYLAQLASAVQYLHRNGICHRDLKPSNILCYEGYIVRICDFGSARTKFLIGGDATPEVQTLYWRAPEMVLGAKHYGTEIDVYSLGIVFAEILLGYCPIWLGSNDSAELLPLLFRILDGMTLDAWPEIEKLPRFRPRYLDIKSNLPSRTWRSMVDGFNSIDEEIPIDDEMVSLIGGMCYGNPAQRLTMDQVTKRLSKYPDVRTEIGRLREIVSATSHAGNGRLIDTSDQYRLPANPSANSDHTNINELLRDANDFILWLCIKTDRPTNFCYAKEFIRRYAATMGQSANNDKLEHRRGILAFDSANSTYLAAAAVMISSKLHDIFYIDADVIMNHFHLYPNKKILPWNRPDAIRVVNCIRMAEKSILIALDFDLIFPSCDDIEDNYIGTEEEFENIPWGGELIHDYHEKLRSYSDFITVVHGLTYLTEVLSDGQFQSDELTKFSLYLALRVFNRQVKAVFSLLDLERIEQSWKQYVEILFRETKLPGCNLIRAASRVSDAVRAALQIGLFDM